MSMVLIQFVHNFFQRVGSAHLRSKGVMRPASCGSCYRQVFTWVVIFYIFYCCTLSYGILEWIFMFLHV